MQPEPVYGTWFVERFGIKDSKFVVIKYEKKGGTIFKDMITDGRFQKEFTNLADAQAEADIANGKESNPV